MALHVRGRVGTGLVAMLLGLVLAAGCGGATAVRGTVVSPAEVPVRSFPRIWIAGGHLDQELALLDGLADHLRGGAAEVRRVELDTLEPMRRAGQISPATVVLILELEMDEDTRPEWSSRPETVCTPVGCYTTQRSYMYQLPVLQAVLTVTVYDGPTARVQQRKVLRARDEGRDFEDMRRVVVRQLERRLIALVDQQRRPVRVELLPVDVDLVERAIEAVEDQGDWTRARKLLERAWRTEEVRALDDEDRARVLYDIGQARRFDPATQDDLESHFAAAERAFDAAIRLDPEPLYSEALESLEAHRRQVRAVRAQQEAAEHNYRLARPPRGVPQAPPSYRQPPRASEPPSGEGEGEAAPPPEGDIPPPPPG